MKGDNSTKSSVKISRTYYLFLVIILIILIISIIIPLFLVNLNQNESCLHHIEEDNGTLWIVGRALGFTTFVWFIVSSIFGINTKKLAKSLKSYLKARNLHCLNATITITVFLIHIGTLLGSNPWGDLIFDGEYNHIPYPLFMLKLWTGILFGLIMSSVALSAFYFRDLGRMKKFGFKNFIKVHYIMLSLSFILGIHIFLINTELLILFWG